MALGVLVVASAVDGAVELVEDGDTGRLVKPADERALAHAVAEMLLERDRARRIRRTSGG